jgi:hypothetical protein
MGASRNPSSATFPADPAQNPDACFGSTRRSPGFGRLLSDVLTETVTLLCVSPLRGTGPHRVRRISRASGTPEVVCAVHHPLRWSSPRGLLSRSWVLDRAGCDAPNERGGDDGPDDRTCATISGVPGQLTRESAHRVDPGRATPRNEQLISVPVCIGFPSAVALRIARETYETAALPLSYVGAVQE